ncbi:MAG: phosphomannomutase/phosphoglucomutase [Alphaproteobacteria bacterium]|nr:phosphomannomutase/phosphoglucomutase [Alphaproteobacteria bacterium]MBV8548518.1 phosphomannomutase/phosphoglucomutase [Alphaproteobacteria bacterium]
MPHIFNPTIIREYDIRGTVGKNLTPMDAYHLGLAFGSKVARATLAADPAKAPAGSRPNHVMVGFDGRTHSPQFEEALLEGLLETGMSVDRIGLGPSPMLYFSVFHHQASAGIMVTGSHNPPDQNGFKMLMGKHLPGGGPVYGEAIKEIAAIAKAGDYVPKARGSAAKIDVSAHYLERLLRDADIPRDMKIVWDCGNGAGGDIVKRLTKELPGKHILLFADIDGRFPNHHPDPTVAANLKDLQQAVADNKADFGVGFDGDADRIGAVDSQGRIVAGDQLLAIYAEEVLKTHPGAAIIADVKASQIMFDRVRALGGNPIMWKVGHSLIKSKMTETNAPLAAEMSGHVFFADKYYGFDDAIYAAVRLLSQVARSGKSLDDFRDALPTVVNTPEIRFAVPEERKFAIVDEIRDRLKKAGASMIDIDGVRVMTPQGWWLLRASNTQAALSARVEAKSEAALPPLRQQLADQLAQSGVTLPEGDGDGH